MKLYLDHEDVSLLLIAVTDAENHYQKTSPNLKRRMYVLKHIIMASIEDHIENPN